MYLKSRDKSNDALSAVVFQPQRIDFTKPVTASGGGEFDPATSITLKMVLDQDEADAGSVIFVNMPKPL